jgi:hypothetical protein
MPHGNDVRAAWGASLCFIERLHIGLIANLALIIAHLSTQAFVIVNKSTAKRAACRF